MKKIIIPALAAAVLTFGSCSTSKYTEARAIPVNDVEIFAHPVIANLKVSAERKSWTLTIKRNDAIAMGLNINNMRAYAIAIACKDGNPDSPTVYDAIVGGTVIVKSSGKRYDLEVTGYPAVYNSFRNMSENDMNILKFSGQGNTVVPTVEPRHFLPFGNKKNNNDNAQKD